MYTSFFTSHHTGIFTGKEKKKKQQQQQKNIPGPLKLE